MIVDIKLTAIFRDVIQIAKDFQAKENRFKKIYSIFLFPEVFI